MVVMEIVLSGSTAMLALGGTVILVPLMLITVGGASQELAAQLVQADEDQLHPRHPPPSTTESSVCHPEGPSATELPVCHSSSSSTAVLSAPSGTSPSPTGLADAAAELPCAAAPAAAAGRRTSPPRAPRSLQRPSSPAVLLEGDRQSRSKLWRLLAGMPPGAFAALVCIITLCTMQYNTRASEYIRVLSWA